MKKQTKVPTILKPLIDEDAALRFAFGGADKLPEAAPKQTQSKAYAETTTGMRSVSLAISKDLYNKIAKEASKKNRTVEEHLIKHLAKRYEK
jgi:hypothetical protein